MNHRLSFIASAPALLALASAFATSPSDAHPGEDGLPFAAEVQSCVDAVNAELELRDARRVRHLVLDAKRTGIGYALTIETSVLLEADGDAIEKRYEALCVAYGANEPSTLRIEEIAI
ncbi:MAG TPA: hypothetical protein VE175_01730 [Woeseiaceae bacterium]|nr:hypothetical protein [Woeseiaceae bacterium]